MSISTGRCVQVCTLLLCMAGTFMTHDAVAQDISTYYTVQHPDQFKINWTAFYHQANELTAKTRKEFPHQLDIPYGKNVKERLDLYFPKQTPHDAPVFLFLHGGGFREGDRAQYGFIAAPFAKHGIITAVASYRLTGKGFHYPAQTDDARDALRWLYKNIARYGGDPNNLFVGGHSAGAILTAEIGVDRAWMSGLGIPKNSFKGIIAVSAPYDLRVPGRPGETSAFAPTPELQEQASPLLHVVDPVPVAIVAVGSTEKYVGSSRLLVQALKKQHVDTTLIVLPGEDHRGAVMSLVDEKSPLFQAALKMMQP